MQLITGTKVERDSIHSLIAKQGSSSEKLRTPAELAALVAEFASTNGWLDRVRLRAEGRWYERLYLGPDHDIWVISWLPGQSTGFHDHGESAGAFVVTTGTLEEHRPGERTESIHPQQPRAFGLGYAHDVRNSSLAPAISIHAYSPPLDEMNEFELDGGQLVHRERTLREADTLDEQWRIQRQKPADRTELSTIEQMLSVARARLRRISPMDAVEALSRPDSVLVDIRPEAQRASEGTIDGALIVERNVLEWRFDPTSSSRLEIAADHHLRVIVFCSEGYTSSLAAASLQDLGLWRATDVVGGFQAWQASGLPIVAPTRP